MKKFLFITAIMAGVFGFISCGPHLYSTSSAGKDNISYVVVLSDVKLQNVSIFIDEQPFKIDKVYAVKYARKAHPVLTTPGKHNLKLVAGGKIIRDESIFLGVQETKQIVITLQELNNPTP